MRRSADRGTPQLRWYREIAIIGGFYAIYTMVRNQFGSESVDPARALENALKVIEVERAMGAFVEADIQGFFLGWGSAFIRFWNLYYGTLHFVVTAGVMLWLYRRHPGRYPRWRNTLGLTTGLGLFGFSLFPLMPPRLVGTFGPFGGADLDFTGVFVDTLAHFPTLWSFNSEAMQSVSNQYAAMPSLHVGWAMWCAAAAIPVIRHRSLRWLFALYVPATVFTIVVTANHYWLDGVGGMAVFGVGYVLAGRIERLRGRARHEDTDDEQDAAEPVDEPADEVLVG